MKRLTAMKKSTKNSLFTYALVIAAFVVVQILRAGPGVGSLLEGQLVPICAYIVMALSLNLVVGCMGEFSLGHAGFVSVGAYASAIVSGLLTGKGLPDLALFVVALAAGFTPTT